MVCEGRSATPGALLLLLAALASGLLLPRPALAQGSEPRPFIRNTANAPREFHDGDDILLTCVVADLGNHTVWWSKNEDGKKTILTVAERRISNDERISLLHDRAGGDVWVLVIKNAKRSDTGMYVCEINSNPSLTSHYMVTVTEATPVTLRSTHNYTDCCIQNGVSPQCIGFCAIHNIVEGKTGIEPEACETYFPFIVKCMADMRNHVPCCERQRVPDICQDLCRGEYTMQEDRVQSHFSCTAYTEATLMCISEGIEIMPSAPESPSVEVLGPTAIHVKWERPAVGTPPPEHYVINVTTITKFDPPVDVTVDASGDGEVEGEGADKDSRNPPILPKRMQVKVVATQTEAILNSLTPMTWYEVSVVAVNRHGSSLPNYNLRVLTHALGTNKTSVVHPELPDVVGCCSDKGVKHYRCLRNLCDPSNRYINEPDMIVCAPWATEAFSCLANDIDHSDCCRERGLPPLCVEICSGNVTKIDYKYFRCVDYFSDYRSCLMKGYNVLPGAPRAVSISNIHPTFVLLNWLAPEILGDSVTAYHAYFRPIQPNRECESKWFINNMEVSYHGVYTQSPPYVLEKLCEDTEYEVYVQAVNKHGTGDPSERVLFRTTSVVHEKRLQETAYNVTKCCRSVNISPGCMPLCDYNARMSHVRVLAATCTAELSSLLRCAVGGRNHQPCCQRRGVPASCMSLCAGSFSNQATPAVCMPYIGNIMMCLEEGVGVLPGPVTDLHATKVADGEVTLVWQPPSSGANVTFYQLHYQSVDKHSAALAVYSLNNTMNLTDTVATVSNLRTANMYNFFVISMNEEGTSLPSAVLTINATAESHKGGSVAGVSSAPHSLVLDTKTATTLTVVWQPPELAHPTDRFTYQLHYRALGSPGDVNKYNKTHTGATAMTLKKLTPNTQYVIYVTAENDMGESRPSETLLAWTDPAYPAFVEAPTVHPINLIVEGGKMTVLCIAMGSPPPTVSLYISGILIHQDVTRHMVTVVQNVTRDMREISCYADNGYGTPMQASRTITISRRPIIKARKKTRVVEGHPASLECAVDAWPEPSLVWWEDHEERVPVIHGGNYVLETITNSQGEGSFLMRLTIRNVNQTTAQQYYCHAQNAFGHSTRVIEVDVNPPVRLQMDATECCVENNVTDTCIEACSFDELNFARVMDNDKCIPDFSKLMKCAADGSDHRSCCSRSKVPRACLDWCRGEPVPHMHLCELRWAPVIISCFNEGQDLLPGPPIQVEISSYSETSAMVSWQPPAKNPDAVELYRVFWRKKGYREARKNDTAATELMIDGLQEGETYEVAVKAGNHRGTSILTRTITFNHRLSSVTWATTKRGSNTTVVEVAVVVVVLLCIGVVLGVLWARKRNLLGAKSSSNGRISFENPSYIREQNGDTVQIAETPSGSFNGSMTLGMNGGISGGMSNGGINGGVSPIDVNGGIWNTQTVSSSTPGFEDDLPSNGGYKRFSS